MFIRIVLLLIAFSPSVLAQGNYDYKEAFKPGFYNSGGTATRSASGQPGPQYWQNRADYVLSATLHEEQDRIDGSAEITYTKNSPDALSFLWIQLDQNLFKADSRGNAMVPLSGSRNGSGDSDFDGGFNINHDTSFQSSGRMTPYTDNLYCAIRGHFAYQCHNFGSANVQTGDDVFFYFFCHYLPVSNIS